MLVAPNIISPRTEREEKVVLEPGESWSMKGPPERRHRCGSSQLPTETVAEHGGQRIKPDPSYHALSPEGVKLLGHRTRLEMMENGSARQAEGLHAADRLQKAGSQS